MERIWIVALAVSLAVPAAAAMGAVRGVVRVDGESDVPGYRLSEAVVYLEGALPARGDGRTQVVVMDQRDRAYTPRVLPVAAGTPIEIRNSDPELHNVHAVSRKNRAFNLAMPKGMSPQKKVFSKPELVTLSCNVHRDMRGYILVLDNPYFATAAKDGAFQIAGVPPGRYAVKLWHEKFEEVGREVTVADGGAAVVDFDLDSSKAIRRR